ncbi:MAG: response regulator [Bacteroidia bacterium]|nr:response regulator [Bacteroidia bacterium]
MNRVLLIDDEALARDVLRHYLGSYPEFEILEECSNGFDAVKAIQKHKPDLIFLDIQMPRINGFETLELIEHQPKVIFTTAYDEYALKAFELQALDYLLKPFSEARFAGAIQKYLQGKNALTENHKLEALLNSSGKHSEEARRVVVKDGSRIQILPVEEISHLEAYDDYVKVFHKDNLFLKKNTLSYYEQSLDPKEFLRVHRSFMLNLNFLHRLETLDKHNVLAHLKNGVKIPVSRAGYAKLREVLGL